MKLSVGLFLVGSLLLPITAKGATVYGEDGWSGTTKQGKAARAIRVGKGTHTILVKSNTDKPIVCGLLTPEGEIVTGNAGTNCALHFSPSETVTYIFVVGYDKGSSSHPYDFTYTAAIF